MVLESLLIHTEKIPFKISNTQINLKDVLKDLNILEENVKENMS